MSKSKLESAIEKFVGETAQVAQSLDYPESDKMEIPLSQIVPNSFQPRKTFQDIDKLAKSIEKDGLIQPVVVRKREGGYELVVGERRLKAVEKLGWEKIPAIVRDFSDGQMVEMALIENLNRDDLNPLEETEGILNLLRYKTGLKDNEEVKNLLYQMSNEKYSGVKFKYDAVLKVVVFKVFETLGQSWESFLKHKMPLLNLPDDLKLAIIEGNLSHSHTEELRKVEDEETRKAITEYVIRNELGIRETKKMVRENIAEEDELEGPARKRKGGYVVAHFKEVPGLKVSKKNTKVLLEIDLKKGNLKEAILHLSRLVKDNTLQRELKLT